jgi:hypothetical protein
MIIEHKAPFVVSDNLRPVLERVRPNALPPYHGIAGWATITRQLAKYTSLGCRHILCCDHESWSYFEVQSEVPIFVLNGPTNATSAQGLTPREAFLFPVWNLVRRRLSSASSQTTLGITSYRPSRIADPADPSFNGSSRRFGSTAGTTGSTLRTTRSSSRQSGFQISMQVEVRIDLTVEVAFESRRPRYVPQDKVIANDCSWINDRDVMICEMDKIGGGAAKYVIKKCP